MAVEEPRLGERSRTLGVLTAAYSVLALAALSRSGYQLATGTAPPVAVALSGLAGVVYLVAALGLRGRGPGARRLVLGCCSVELAGVVVTSLVELAVGGYGRSVVWSGLGYGYLFLPLVLPVLGIRALVGATPDR